MESLKLTIEGMHCGGCVNRVTMALQKLPGVQVDKVEVGSAEVRYEGGQAGPASIAAAVNKIGFAARPVD